MKGSWPGAALCTGQSAGRPLSVLQEELSFLTPFHLETCKRIWALELGGAWNSLPPYWTHEEEEEVFRIP